MYRKRAIMLCQRTLASDWVVHRDCEPLLNSLKLEKVIYVKDSTQPPDWFFHRTSTVRRANWLHNNISNCQGKTCTLNHELFRRQNTGAQRSTGDRK